MINQEFLMALNITGEQTIKADIQTVWKALNDVDVLKQCIPGCESLEQKSDKEMSAVVVLKVGPVKAKFSGEVTLSNINAPQSYTITGEGKGGIAGFAKGGAEVKLEETADGTLLNYEAKADVGGKIAQLGSRLIDSTSKKLAAQFFDKFGKIVEAQAK
jgi:carbon monoxide dehydrogenase subunit G